MESVPLLMTKSFPHPWKVSGLQELKCKTTHENLRNVNTHSDTTLVRLVKYQPEVLSMDGEAGTLKELLDRKVRASIWWPERKAESESNH
ncbi:hypothetical protein TNCV_2452121 [Trichonephila clavipes]|nr:hypothetical protein TNCV_2452121 [Trichonephila clavipes]